MSTVLCEGRTFERSKRLFRCMHRPSVLCGTHPADTCGTGNCFTATVSLTHTHSTVARTEWWDSPTVLHTPFAPNLHASRTETSLEPVVVCAQSSPDRRRTVCVARPRRSPVRVCCFLVVGAAVRHATQCSSRSVFPSRALVIVKLTGKRRRLRRRTGYHLPLSPARIPDHRRRHVRFRQQSKSKIAL